MRLPLRLCIVVGLGAALTGAEDAAPPASPSAVSSDRSFSFRGAAAWGRAVALPPSGGISDEDDTEDSSCPDWRVRR